ncbi:MAG: molybdopterin molybdotransferase MoeA [Bacillota bacterium]|nr:molybdopterin molybdotransferase MoeA [Bacillota bacterium]
MQSVEEARRLLLHHLRQPAEELVPLASAGGRVLSRPVRRHIPEPPFTRSRVDGYAVASADLEERGAPPSRLAVTGVVLAGEEPPAPFPPGSALRVMAGAALPEGTGAVVPFEEVPEGEDAQPGDLVTLQRRPVPGENIIPAGREGSRGSLVLPAGEACGPVELGLLAAAGEAAVWAYRRPRVGLIATGSELVPLGEPLSPGKIYASNLYLLSGLVAAWGGVPHPAAPIPDQRAAVREALEGEARGADLVLVTGGVAGGDRDLSRRVLSELGWPVLLDGVDFHPGGRCAVARVPGSGAVVCFLSGGPGACLTAAVLLVAPAVASLAGRGWSTLAALLAEDPEGAPAGVPSGRGRRRAVPVELSLSAGRLWAHPQPHSSGAPVIARGTDGVILLPPGGGGGGRGAGDSGGPVAGETVEVWPLAPLLPDGGVPGKKCAPAKEGEVLS